MDRHICPFCPKELPCRNTETDLFPLLGTVVLLVLSWRMHGNHTFRCGPYFHEVQISSKECHTAAAFQPVRPCPCHD